MRRPALRPALASIALLLAVNCGGGSKSVTAPTPAAAPAPPPPWSLSGRVTATNTNTAVSRAHVDAFITAADTDASGAFTLTAPTGPPANQAFTATAAGYITRESVIRLPRTDSLTIDLISTAAPFDQTFYSQLARDAKDTPDADYPLYRWSTQLKFYLRTQDENGRPLTSQILETIRKGIREGVQYYTNNTYQAVIEEGPEQRPERTGYVNVEAKQVIPDGDYCGLSSSVGGNPMTIQLRIDVCGCGSIKVPVDVVEHEVGHAVGMFHVDGADNIMNATSTFNCRDVIPTARERYHAALMYARVRGNRSPDRDPGGTYLVWPMDGPAPGPRP
jgi:hypothetical protein